MPRVKPSSRKDTYDFDHFRVRWLARYGWIVERGPAVVVVPISPDGRVWMARITRPPTGQTTWELPGGGVDPGEDVLLAGLRELEEECGLVARGAVRLDPTVYEPIAGNGTVPHRLVVAEGVVPKGSAPRAQRAEGIDRVRRFSEAQIGALVRRGRITVYATLASLYATLAGRYATLAGLYASGLVRRRKASAARTGQRSSQPRAPSRTMRSKALRKR
jgi:ADP-ribose pyrophosphatase